MMTMFVAAEEALAERWGVGEGAEPVGEVGPVLKVVNWALENGL
jgi:hypothetical protein